MEDANNLLTSIEKLNEFDQKIKILENFKFNSDIYIEYVRTLRTKYMNCQMLINNKLGLYLNNLRSKNPESFIQ